MTFRTSVVLAVAIAVPAVAAAQSNPTAAPGAAVPAVQAPAVQAPTAPPAAAQVLPLPSDFVIGADDVLSIVVWREKDLSTDVTVRPDGRITLPLINDVMASGLSPDQLRDELKTQFDKFVEDPSVSVVVKAINSRKVFITGMVSKPGPFPVTSPVTVLQLISMAGGLNEFARQKEIIVMRTEHGKQVALKFNYDEVRKGKKLQQNIELRPGDTVVVP